MNLRRAAIALGALALLAACSSDDPIVVTQGDVVSVFYTGTLDDGTEFDSNVGGETLDFEVGGGQVIAGFDNAVVGMSPGESVTVRIEPADAYGERSEELVFDVTSDGAPAELTVGDRTMLSDGRQVTIVAIGEGTITVDANHPLAGQALTFEIELASVDR